MADVLRNLEIDEDLFFSLLERMINIAELLQNSPPDLEPQEGLVADMVFEALAPYLVWCSFGFVPRLGMGKVCFLRM